MRRKQKNIQKKYWSGKGFDSNKEFLIYQLLCENLRSRTKIRKIDKTLLFYMHKPWREHIESILNNYDNNDMEEFYHFVRLQKRKHDINFGMQTSMMIPLIVALVAGILAPSTLNFITFTANNISIFYELAIFFIILIIMMMLILVFMFVVIFNDALSPYIDYKNKIYFWTDCMEIIEDKLKIIKTKE